MTTVLATRPYGANLLPTLAKTALAYVEAPSAPEASPGNVPNDLAKFISHKLPQAIQDKNFSIPETSKLKYFFDGFIALLQSWSKILEQKLDRNSASILKGIISNSAAVNDTDILVTESEHVRCGFSTSGTQTRGTVQIGGSPFQFTAKREYAGGSSYNYYTLWLNQPETDFHYYFHGAADLCESELGLNSMRRTYNINGKDRRLLESFTHILVDATKA